MSLKSLMKAINQHYVSRLLDFKENQDIPANEAITLIEWVSEYYLNQFSVIKIAEKKLMQLLQACVKY
jgi:hypothetical protein